jgi:hypothetical protein
MINDTSCTREIKSRIAVAKVTFNNDDDNKNNNNNNNNNKTHFCSKLDLRKKLSTMLH